MPPDHLNVCCALLQQILVLLQTLLALLAELIGSSMHRDPIPYHTSRLSGEMWVQEVLTGHPDHICCEFGMSEEVFVELVEEL